MTLDYTSIRLNLQTLVHLVCHCRALCTRTVYDGRHACAAKMNSEHHYINTQLTYTLEAISRITTINTSTDKTTKVVLLHVALE